MRLPSSNLSAAIAESRTYTPCCGSTGPDPSSASCPPLMTIRAAPTPKAPPIMVAISDERISQRRRELDDIRAPKTPTLWVPCPRTRGHALFSDLRKSTYICAICGYSSFLKILHPQRSQSFHFLRINSRLIRPDSQLQRALRRRGRQLLPPLGQ